ncbi:MAG: response regulator, partial [Pseudobdellovibrionaceae bacterium]
ESYRVTWESAWPAIGEPFERARQGETTFLENQRMFLFRNGYLEETFFTFSLSPIRDEAGEVVGLFHPVTETTTAMLNQRRTRLLRDITSETANSDNVSEAVQRIVNTLADYQSDIPGAIIFLEKDPGSFEAIATSGDVNGFTNLALWPINKAMATSQPCYIDDVPSKFGELSCSEYREPIQRACLLPIQPVGHKTPIGFLAATLSTRLPLNEAYMAFFDMLNNAVTAAITNALANENINTERAEFQTDIHDLRTKRNSQDAAAQILLESKETAEAATRSKSAFLANMSHEIRTPLSAILGFTEILKSHDIETEDRDKYLNIIGRNGHSLVRIIDDILDLSKIEAGKIEIEKEPVCLSELVQDVMAMFSDRAAGKGLSLHFDPIGLPRFNIQSDAVRIRQILVNLLGNAIKFTTEGSITVRGYFKPVEDSHYEITLSVTDTGIGITPKQAATLFQAFTQADDKTTRHFGGTGLGLALSKKLANAMGGNISIEKNENIRGTTFLVQLIATRSIQQPDNPLAASVPTVKSVTKRLKGWSILIVDDLEDNRMLLKILLEREGAIIHEASSGEEGIRKAHEYNFDLILMDIQMPELDGYQALAKLRSQNYKKPIFALTAHTMKEEKDRALAAGFSGHISKPVNPKTIVETLLAHARSLH